MAMAITASRHIRASAITSALDIIGDRWTLLILREAFLGVQRFEQWHHHLGIARRLLADRLKRLVASKTQPFDRGLFIMEGRNPLASAIFWSVGTYPRFVSESSMICKSRSCRAVREVVDTGLYIVYITTLYR